ncbi:hypothetical protein KZ483_24340 [Paenibacillus sp. sptzw28]|nr:hypothetical protein [Paenibacillus sp. sptzw28]QYR20850.1 hypothetical protein KZ483_24340 [Paenibacillus sp. sptzw28]
MPGLESCGTVQRRRRQPESRLGAEWRKIMTRRPKAKAVVVMVRHNG